MKIISFLCIKFFLIFFACNIYSQDRGSISGKVIDSRSGIPIGFASVTLINNTTNSVTAGAETNDLGEFRLTEVPFGSYRLEINFIGYNTSVTTGLELNSQNRIITLGNITLTEGITETETIEVETERSDIEFRPDRRIFNFGDNQLVKGGNALDVLREVPSVSVDVDGNVSLRGSENVKIQIDGRSFGLEGSNRIAILEQLSADQIERVELITNPSARFDPEGSSGIINIVLKKSTDPGYNGTLSLNAGTKDKYTGAVNFNFQRDNFNLFGNYSYNKMNIDISGFSVRNYIITDDLSLLDRNTGGFRRRGGHFVKAGFDYNFNPQTRFGLAMDFRQSERKNSSQTNSTGYDNSGDQVSESISKQTGTDNGNRYGLNLTFLKILGKPSHRLTADFSFEKDKDDDITHRSEFYIIPFQSDPFLSRDNRKEDNADMEFNTDYILPLGEDSKFEAGYRGTYKRIDDNFKNYEFDQSTGEFILNTNVSNNFLYKQFINAVYGSLTSGIADFNYSLGLRAEQTNIAGETDNSSRNFDRNYFDLFPTLSISRKLGLTQEIQASYSRRIRRPRTWFLNPFIRYIDQFNIMTGNLELKPEYSNSFELNYIYFLPFGTITPSLFYRETSNEISRFSTLIDSVTTLTTFANLNSSKSYGVDFIVSARPFRPLNLNGNISYYRTDVDAGNLFDETNRSSYSWRGRLSSTITLPEDIGIQMSYNYSGKRVTARGTVDPFQTFDISVRKDLLDKKLSLSLRVQDLFKTRKFSSYYEGIGYTETSERNFDGRNAFFSISYRFGGNDSQDRRRREQQRPQEEDFEYMDF